MDFVIKKIIQIFFSLSLFSFNVSAELPIKQSGKLLGILTSKGEAWVQVKEDGGLVSRYLAPWQGGSPSRGGGFNLKSIERFKELVVGNRVWIEWYWDGHLRVNKIKELKPSKKSGIFNGTLVKKGTRWIDVESEENQTPWRFYARWVGGQPEDGGGYNPKTVEFFDNFKINDPVRFAWSYDFRPRIEKFMEQEKDDVFVPFYEGKTDPNLSDPISAPLVSPVINPFDQVNPVKSVNPFDQVPENASPFDQVSPSSNPFDQVPTNSESPFDQVPTSRANPFENNKVKSDNPFEQVDQKMKGEKPVIPSNPFEKLPSPDPKEANPFDDTPLPGNPFENVPLPGNPFEAVPK